MTSVEMFVQLFGGSRRAKYKESGDHCVMFCDNALYLASSWDQTKFTIGITAGETVGVDDSSHEIEIYANEVMDNARKRVFTYLENFQNELKQRADRFKEVDNAVDKLLDQTERRIIINPSKDWLKDQKALAKRIAQIIGFTHEPEFDSSADKWVLNCTNDWWLDFRKDGTTEIRYRYYHVYTSQQITALKTVIEMFVGEKNGSK